MVSLEQRIHAVGEVLARQVKAGMQIAESTDTEPCKPLQNFQNTNQVTESNRGQSQISVEGRNDAEHLVR